jgi:hypothetical protein
MNKIPDIIIEKTRDHEMILQHAAYLSDVEPMTADEVYNLRADGKVKSLIGVPDDALFLIGVERLADARAIAKHAERDNRSVGLTTQIIYGSAKYRGLILVTLTPRK